MRHILLLAFFAYAGTACADEMYEFHKITCDKTHTAFKMEKVAFWDIGEQIWPWGYEEEGVSQWTTHVRAMKALEKNQHLYVLDEAYGHYDGPMLTFSCSPYLVKIHVQKMERDECEDIRKTGRVECHHYYRAFPHLTILNRNSKKVIVKNMPISGIDDFSVGNATGPTGKPEDTVCFSNKCLSYKSVISRIPVDEKR